MSSEQKLLRRKQRAHDENNTQQLAQMCRKLAELYHDKQQYQDALVQYKEEAKAYRSLAMVMDAGLANRMIGEMYMLLEDFDEALNYELRYLKAATDENNQVEQQRACATIGRVYLLQAQSNPTGDDVMKLLKRAEKYFLESLLACKSLKDLTKTETLDMQARLYLNLGVTNECKAAYREAINNYEKAMTICRHNDFWELLHQCYTSAAVMYSNKLDDSTKALRFLNLAINIAERLSTNRSERICQTLLFKAEAQIKMGEFRGAKQVLHKAYKMKTTDVLDRESIETNLRIVAAMCLAEDALVNAESNDSEKCKKHYETMGDGACKLKNFEAAIGYYRKMLEVAETNGDDAKNIIPIYVSLYQTYKDMKRYDEALEYMWKEFQLCKDVPAEAFSTLCAIAEVNQLAAKDFWQTDGIFDRARSEAKKLNDTKKERVVLAQQIALRRKNGMDTIATLMEEEASRAGLDVTNISAANEEESDDEFEENTPDVGDDICLDNLSDNSASEDDGNNAHASTSTNQSRTLRRRGVIKVKKNDKGETQLHRACIAGNLTLVRRLIDQGHPVNVRDNAGWSPLHEAANHGFKDVVEVLLDNGASINDKGGTNCDGVTPLHDACGNGVLEVVEVLLDRGANATLKTDLNSTPLQLLDEWRRSRLLEPIEQTYYETIRNRLVQKLDKAGMHPSPMKVVEHMDPDEHFSPMRSKSNTPRKRIMSSSSDGEDAAQEFDSENIDTVEQILHEEFPSTKRDSDVEMSEYRERATRSPPAEDLNYRRIMADLRTNNLQNNVPFGSGCFQPVGKVSKRSGMLAADEVEDGDWLDDDIGHTKKKRRTNESSGSRLSLSGSSRKSTETAKVKAQISDTVISSTFENFDISVSDDDEPVDAFTVLMSSTDNPGRRARSSGSKSSRDTYSRPQSSLLDIGFTRHRMDSPEPACVSSTVVSPTEHVYSIPAAPSSTAYSVKVKVEENLLNVPIVKSNADDLTIEWLAQEAAKRYYNLRGVKPVLRLTTSDGAIYENSDPLHVIFNETSVIASTVLEWITPPLSQRYLEACAQFKCTGDPYIQSKLELIPSSQTLTITDQFVTSTISRPLFKAIHFQSNLRTIDLTNSFIEDDGVKHLSQALPTLAQLSTLNLTGNLITSIGVKHMLAAFELQPNCLFDLRELYLSHNPLQNLSLMSLSTICEKLPALRVLHLASTELTHLREFDLNFASLVDLDLSYNSFETNGLTKAIEKLNSCHLTRLNVSFCCAGVTDTDDMVDQNESSLIEALVRMFNAGTCANLEEIQLTGCQLNDVDCWRLLQPIGRSKVLRLVALGDNSRLTKVSFKHLAETVPTKSLRLDGCKMIVAALNEADVEAIKSDHCPESITLSMPNTSGDSEEISNLMKFWSTMSRGRGKLFLKNSHVLMTLKGDSFNALWGYSLC